LWRGKNREEAKLMGKQYAQKLKAYQIKESDAG
jgi:hypothetical protein